MSKNKLKTVLIALSTTFAVAFVGCGDNGTFEDAGEEVDDTLEDVGDEMEDTFD